ncbi:acyl-CoA dehydrogenase domain-containing protein [Caldithrix abyssi DSM 13497]|uniref:Acyl-CoA dehydrogenase domain-containing protein n=1 Tax=Caldithrix abyssi DSM 13497 TaxID=880073 RepID=H1XSF6_CALAY|nr:acyl-CoA dehydrogenase family protein [Caldithrix abyssi]APF17234.1 glutaryl-CoA dehydrogenase [Caldithrix abyssi DSM 13497]EHO41368.1 acyl-CoA dehydrogenase domain-containing protein [Caldithrix abyssi DSM 13497]
MVERSDFLGVFEQLSEEERMIMESLRAFVDEQYLPIIREYHARGEFPFEMVPQLAELGLFGITIPEEYGGAGLSYFIYGLAMQELERGDSGLRSLASVQNSLVMFPIFKYGSEEQKQKWLPLLASGQKIGCFGLTEPDHGSDPGGMETRAEKVSGGWRLNGSKMWITNGTVADVAVVWAKTSEGVSGFLVEKGTKGFIQNKIHGKFSLRASDTGELVFEDCEIPEENRLPQARGLRAPLSCLNEARYGIAWGAIGAAMACYEEARDYALTRTQFSKPIAGFQLVQHKLVEMISEITKGLLLNLQLGRMKDAGKAKHYHISMAKRNNVHQALQIARSARSILAANGIIDEYQTIRHMLNLESVYTYEGTHDIHTLIIGEAITGIEAFR